MTRLSTPCFFQPSRSARSSGGVLRQQVKNPVFAEALRAWLDRTVETYRDRILRVDTRVARRWGRLSARVRHGGAELLIAATALENGLTVVTRLPTGVPVEDPFQDPA